MGDGSSMCRLLGEDAVLERLHHLDHTCYAGGGLGVAEIGLHRAESAAARNAPPIGREQGLCLDGVTQRGAGAVCLDRVDI